VPNDGPDAATKPIDTKSVMLDSLTTDHQQIRRSKAVR